VRARASLPGLKRVVALRGGASASSGSDDARLLSLEEFTEHDAPLDGPGADPSDLASIVYTSGATGRPKGVMQSQRALLENARAFQACVRFEPGDLLFSNLPLAHLFGRVAWIYAGMLAGAGLMFGRGAGLVAEDLATQRPTVLVGAPRLFERIHGTLVEELERSSAARRALFYLAVEAGWANASRRRRSSGARAMRCVHGSAAACGSRCPAARRSRRRSDARSRRSACRCSRATA
jgi:long-chain acyl-CoA synthetase